MPGAETNLKKSGGIGAGGGHQPVQFPIHPAVQLQGGNAQGNPHGGKGGTDVAQHVSRLIPVVPHLILPIKQQAGGQFHGGDDSGAAACLKSGGKTAAAQLAQQHIAQPTGAKHTDVAAPPVEQFQGHIGGAAHTELSHGFHKLHPKSPQKQHAQNFSKKTGNFLLTRIFDTIL